MTDNRNREQSSAPAGRQPIFLLPGIVLGLVGIIVAIHVAQAVFFDAAAAQSFTIWFAFIPLRFLAGDAIPGGILPLLWTPFTHAFLHAGWDHLLLNMVWLAIFGTPVARRYGPAAFLILFLLSALAGALAFAATTFNELQILVGASGGIAGLTGAAMRFVFQPVKVARHPETGEVVVLGRQLASLGEMLRNRSARAFVIFWVLMNGIAPVLPIFTNGMALPIAWQAHLGGFFTGLLLVPLFERRR